MTWNARCAAVLTALSLAAVVGCTAPVYHHAFVTKYDADGKVIGYEETESLTQQDPGSGPLKVRITRKDKLET